MVVAVAVVMRVGRVGRHMQAGIEMRQEGGIFPIPLDVWSKVTFVSFLCFSSVTAQTCPASSARSSRNAEIQMRKGRMTGIEAMRGAQSTAGTCR